MARMLPGIETVEQHQERLDDDPGAYRPERCPRCGKAGMHHHGHYERNAPRGEGLAFALSPLFILRGASGRFQIDTVIPVSGKGVVVGTADNGATLRDVVTDIDDLRRRTKYS